MPAFRLPPLKASQLKHWAFLTGAPSSGTKPEIQTALLRVLDASSVGVSDSSRIVSVDMGIRNLAFCAVEPLPLLSSGNSKQVRIRVRTWTRLDLLKRGGDVVADPFAPAALSRTALSVSLSLLQLSPSILLLERQRSRSGSAASVLEWTLRVNALESMLWACLETLRSTRTSLPFPAVHAVSPARMVAFWADGGRDWKGEREENEESQKGMGTGKARSLEKKDRVEIVRSWIRSSNINSRATPSEAEVGNEVRLEFDDAEAAAVAAQFTARRGRGSAGEESKATGKLDDLADCLLQAVAWVRWERNRHAIREMLMQKG